MIPKPGSSKLRRLGIPTARDRTVQAALKLVLEPIFEADFQPCSYGFRPRRRAQDAIAEIHQFTSRSYEWVLEGDIEACFDMIDHTALMDRVRRRVGDKRVLAVVKAFLHAGILGEDGLCGTPAPAPPKAASCRPHAMDNFCFEVTLSYRRLRTASACRWQCSDMSGCTFMTCLVVGSGRLSTPRAST